MTVPSGRGRTRPVTAMQNSLRSVSAVGEGRRAVRIADDLHQAFAVAQVDEDDAAVVAAAMHPARQRDGLAEVAAVDAAAIIGAFHVQFSGNRCRCGSMRRGAGRAAARARPATPAGGATVLPGQFRVFGELGASARERAGAPGGAARRGCGATTPIEMMYLSASSTVMSSSCTRALGTIRK